MEKILFTVIFLMSIATYSQEDKEIGKEYDGWTFITKEKNGDEHYFKFRNLNYFTSAWQKIVYKTPKEEDIEGVTYKAKSKLVLFLFNCKERKIGVQALAIVTDDGVQNIEQEVSEVMVKMMIPYPDTDLENLLELFCLKSK